MKLAFAAFLVLLSTPAGAQDAFFDRWQTIHSAQPAAVNFQISAPKSDFYVGELIPLELTFTSAESNAFVAETRVQDRVGRMNWVEEFLVDPAALTEDPLQGLPGASGAMGGISGPPITLSAKPFTFERLLNEWVHFRQPGQYRIAILTHRVGRLADPDHPQAFLQMAGREQFVSNILTVTISPAPDTWVKEQIAEATRVLARPPDPNAGPYRERQHAAETLRFLESPEAAAQLVRPMGEGADLDGWSMHMGVLGSPYRKQLLPILEARLLAPDQPVWERYLDTLSRLAVLVMDGGPMDSYPQDTAKQASWREESSRREDARLKKRQEYIARLIAVVPAKDPQARAITMNTLLDVARASGSATAWQPALTAALIADFHSLPSRMQSDLLASRWGLLRSSAMLPVLREIIAHPPEPRVDPPLRDTAVRRLYDIAPDEGRRLILAEIAKPQLDLSMATLSTLKDGRLPELNEPLAARIEAGGHVDDLIVRYATGDIVKRVEQAHARRDAELERQKLPHCDGQLVFYYLRFDEAYGEKLLRAEMGKPGGAPACFDMGFQFHTLGSYAYSPALERLAIEFLMSPKVPVKRGAAEILGKCGSPAAQKPLWDAMEYFRSWWKDREQQLEGPEGQEGMQFERALRIAVAQADAWVLGEDGLHRLLDLCTSKWCKQEVQQWLSQEKSPVQIQTMSVTEGFYAAVAQYETHSAEEMRRKVSQFPPGSVFHVTAPPLMDAREREEVEQIVRSAGYSLVP